jgi:hypothetical protein
MSDAIKSTESVSAHGVPPRPFQFRLWHLLAAMGVISVMLAVLVPMWRMARERALRMQSANNLKMIAIGLHNYHDTWNSFPPACYSDASGKPVHSWRVLIAPFIEQGPIYNRYNFAEPWDGPNNSKVAGSPPPVFRSPAERRGTTLSTSYVAIVGPGTMWPGTLPFRIANITDGTSNTLMVVEISHSDIHWMEPRDLPVEELEEWLDPDHKPRLGGRIEGGLVALADGSVHFLPRDVAIERLRKLITPAGNDYQDASPREIGLTGP